VGPIGCRKTAKRGPMTFNSNPGNNPLGYMGVVAPNPADVIEATRTPGTSDTSYKIGTLWINTSTGISYELVGFSGSSATWAILGGATGAVATLTGDSGTATPAAGNILISGGTNLTSSASGSTVTVNLDAAVSNLTSLAATTITTNVAAAQLSLAGTTITATGSDANVSMNLATKGTGSVVMSRSAAGVDLNMQITNSDNTAVSSPAGLQLAVGGGTNTGDPYVQYAVSGVTTWTTGIDNSASDAYVIAASNALGTSNAASWSTAGALTNTGAITATSGAITATNGNVIMSAAGTGVQVKEGSNARMGTATLVAGTVTVSNTSVTANTRIFLSRYSPGASTALGVISVGTVTASTSFVINSLKTADATVETNDVSVVHWLLVEPAT
jgi:hypothetical protein